MALIVKIEPYHDRKSFSYLKTVSLRVRQKASEVEAEMFFFPAPKFLVLAPLLSFGQGIFSHSCSTTVKEHNTQQL